MHSQILKRFTHLCLHCFHRNVQFLSDLLVFQLIIATHFKYLLSFRRKLVYDIFNFILKFQSYHIVMDFQLFFSDFQVIGQFVLLSYFQMFQVIETSISNRTKEIRFQRNIDFHFFFLLPEIKEHFLHDFLSLIYVVEIFSGITT